MDGRDARRILPRGLLGTENFLKLQGNNCLVGKFPDKKSYNAVNKLHFPQEVGKKGLINVMGNDRGLFFLEFKDYETWPSPQKGP